MYKNEIFFKKHSVHLLLGRFIFTIQNMPLSVIISSLYTNLFSASLFQSLRQQSLVTKSSKYGEHGSVIRIFLPLLLWTYDTMCCLGKKVLFLVQMELFSHDFFFQTHQLGPVWVAVNCLAFFKIQRNYIGIPKY